MIHEPGELVSPNRAYYPVHERHSSGLRLWTSLNFNDAGRPDISRRTEPVGVASAIGITIASIQRSSNSSSTLHYVVFPLGIGWVWSDSLEWRG